MKGFVMVASPVVSGLNCEIERSEMNAGKQISAGSAPFVLLSMAPAELIQRKGLPVFAPVAGTSLLWVSNTESEPFISNAAGAFHFSRDVKCVSTEHPTCGFAAWYNPYMGTYGRGAAVYGP